MKRFTLLLSAVIVIALALPGCVETQPGGDSAVVGGIEASAAGTPSEPTAAALTEPVWETTQTREPDTEALPDPAPAQPVEPNIVIATGDDLLSLDVPVPDFDNPCVEVTIDESDREGLMAMLNFPVYGIHGQRNNRFVVESTILQLMRTSNYRETRSNYYGQPDICFSEQIVSDYAMSVYGEKAVWREEFLAHNMFYWLDGYYFLLPTGYGFFDYEYVKLYSHGDGYYKIQAKALDTEAAGTWMPSPGIIEVTVRRSEDSPYGWQNMGARHIPIDKVAPATEAPNKTNQTIIATPGDLLTLDIPVPDFDDPTVEATIEEGDMENLLMLLKCRPYGKYGQRDNRRVVETMMLIIAGIWKMQCEERPGYDGRLWPCYSEQVVSDYCMRLFGEKAVWREGYEKYMPVYWQDGFYFVVPMGFSLLDFTDVNLHSYGDGFYKIRGKSISPDDSVDYVPSVGVVEVIIRRSDDSPYGWQSLSARKED